MSSGLLSLFPPHLTHAILIGAPSKLPAQQAPADGRRREVALGRKHPRDAPSGEMRAGREPSAAEKALAAEVKGLLVGVCEGLNLKDLFPRDAVRGVVEERGLNRLMDPSQAGRPAKMSIADKLQLTKKLAKMVAHFCSRRPCDLLA